MALPLPCAEKGNRCATKAAEGACAEQGGACWPLRAEAQAVSRRGETRAMRVALTAENGAAVFIVEDAHTPQPRVKLVCVLKRPERQAHAVGEVKGERLELQQRRAIDAVAVVVGVIAWSGVQAAAPPWAVRAPVIDNCLIRCRRQVHEGGARVDDGTAKAVLAVSHPAKK